MKRFGLWLLLLCLSAYPLTAQQGPEVHDRELEVWTGGGHSVSGGIGNIGAWNAGLRYGWILTDLHGPGPLRGRFEYAVDLVPIFWVFQPADTAYGVVLLPFALKWDFQQHGRIVPYLETGGGPVYTSRTVPAGISRWNFDPGGAAGVYFLGKKFHWSTEIRYLHISDAGLTNPNPGVNTVQVRVGFGFYRHHK
jgi:Lipid A 3-O-deacylase (PagL)